MSGLCRCSMSVVRCWLLFVVRSCSPSVVCEVLVDVCGLLFIVVCCQLLFLIVVCCCVVYVCCVLFVLLCVV